MTLPSASSTGGGLFRRKKREERTDQNILTAIKLYKSVGGTCSYIKFLMVELSELAEHRGRLVSVLGHSTRQSVSCCRADGFLVVSDVPDQQ